MTDHRQEATMDHANELRRVAKELRAANHDGWPNSCDWGADEIERLRVERDGFKAAWQNSCERGDGAVRRLADADAAINKVRGYRDECERQLQEWIERAVSAESEIERLRVAVRQADERGDEAMRRAHDAENERDVWRAIMDDKCPSCNFLRGALRSIAANTCCDRCQEAALVARAALSTDSGGAGNE